MSLLRQYPIEKADTTRSALCKLRETLDHLEHENEETPKLAELKRILMGRIAEMESKAT